MFSLFVLLFFPLVVWGKDFSDFDSYQKKLKFEDVQKKINVFLKKDSRIEAYYKITPNSLILYNKNRAVDYVLQFGDQVPLQEEKGRKSVFCGIKIALDPGHFGGMYAGLEERFISIGKVDFDEGTLTFLTALYLKELLEQEGAIVFLTKENIGKGAYPEDFFDWLKKNHQVWLTKPINKIFRLDYNPLDLRARAEKINQFGPDLTLIIHYNSHHTEGDLSSNHVTTSSNYNLVFIPGAFCKDELADLDARYEFLRLICTEDLQNSLDLSHHILAKFSEILKVPAVEESDDIRYLGKCCLKLEEGVFARNLALTRLVHGPLCYGETLIQNNEHEYKILGTKNFQVNGIPCSLRIKEVAEAYFEGIKAYLSSN